MWCERWARGDGVVVWTGLDCDLGDFGRWAVICVVRALGVGMELLSGLDWTVIFGIWGDGL